MPLYEYICQECNQGAELLVQGSAEPVCPHCGSGKLARQLSVVASPSRAPSSAGGSTPPGPCGPSCGCHPH